MFFSFVINLFVQLTNFVSGLDVWQQIIALIGIGTIPFIESYFGSFLGTLVGISPWLAVPMAVIGNLACMLLLVHLAGRARSAVLSSRQEGEATERNARQERVARYMSRFGIPGVALLGALVLPTQFTAPALVALGADRRRVVLWMSISIIIWGVGFGFFGLALISVTNA